MKKEKNNIKTRVNNKIVMDDEVSKLIKITIIIIIVFSIFYLITKLVTEDNKIDDNNEIEVEIQYKEIILGNLLKQKESEYYVLVMFEDDIYNPLYNSYFEEYENNNSALSKYDVNINNIFNKKYIADESNFDLLNLKFKESTLLKIKNNKIDETHEGREKIIEKLKKITE
ncbi:MAG: hypothetical protein PHW32_03455 [Bacilli bacterium]|nr:hypothetical protein [Bacilli bacterium]MDD4282194.1 hypothetical protein [Bacilli bacterium]MDD4719197.1 hypothetical protein [Bacilli bacterium]